MRHAVEPAIWHTDHRATFGKLLADQPLMRNVLADLCVESEAATVTALRLARAFDDPDQELFKRIATAVSKYWVCKRSPVVAGEALECLGGNGYVEESGMPRLFREMPLNSIWEGSGNVQCLDVLRALAKSPETFEAFFAELAEAQGADARFDAFVAATRDEFSHPEDIEPRARRIVERMAKALQASLLLRFSPPAVADAYVASRLEGDAGLAFGTLPGGTDFGAIIDRHRNYHLVARRPRRAWKTARRWRTGSSRDGTSSPARPTPPGWRAWPGPCPRARSSPRRARPPRGATSCRRRATRRSTTS